MNSFNISIVFVQGLSVEDDWDNLDEIGESSVTVYSTNLSGHCKTWVFSQWSANNSSW